MESGSVLLETLKGASSISYVSSRLGISRPTLYRYADLYDWGERSKIPPKIRRFFDFCLKSGHLDEEDVVIYLHDIGSGGDRWGEGSGRAACMTGGDRAMIVLRDPAREPSVEVAVDISGETIVIGTYHVAEDRGFVLIDDLVPGHRFKYRTVGLDGSRSGWESFVLGDRGSSPDRRSPDGPLRTP